MYWEDYDVDIEMVSSGRTVTDADIRLFFGATDASHPAHVNDEYAKSHPFGRTVVPGSLVLGVLDGFVLEVLQGRRYTMAHYGYDRIRFIAPVFVGDTIHLVARVSEKKPRNDVFGQIYLECSVYNQNQEKCTVVEDIQLIEKRK